MCILRAGTWLFAEAVPWDGSRRFCTTCATEKDPNVAEHRRPGVRVLLLWDWELLLRWVLSSVAGSLAMMLVFLLWGDRTVDGLEMWLGFLTPALVAAVWQWLEICRRLAVSAWGLFPWLVGATISGLAVLGLLDFTGTTEDYARLAVFAAMFGATGGFFQGLCLRRQAQWADLWGLINGVTCGFGWPAGVYAGSALFGHNGTVVGWVGYGTATGLILACLFRGWQQRGPRIRQE